MNSSLDSSFVEDGAYVNWMPVNGFTGKREKEMALDLFHWKEIRVKFWERRYCTEEDLTEIFNETVGARNVFPEDMIREAHEDLNRQKTSGMALERAQVEQRVQAQHGELTISFAKCTLGDRSHPLCCMNNLGRRNQGMDKTMDQGMVTSTPKTCHSRPAHFGNISHVDPGSLDTPLHIDTSRSSTLQAAELGSCASSRRTSLSSARSTRADSVSSQEDLLPGPSKRRTPKRQVRQESNNSSKKGTQSKRLRLEPETGLVGVQSPSTPGAQSPDWPEPAMDWNQPSTSGPHPSKMCQNKANCSSKCSKGPCHEEMF